MCFGCSKEPSHRDGTFEYPQHMFWLRNKKNNFQLRTIIWGPASHFSSANATPEFEGRGGEELATEISNMLTRAYDCPSCIDLTKLCVVPGQQCWILYVDVLVSMISLNWVLSLVNNDGFSMLMCW